ncbi:MAG: lipocalin family protein [Deltaproteobacteria bacterium]|nr:lipocalin family protein [Deltaproteobacteria bacterium]
MLLPILRLLGAAAVLVGCSQPVYRTTTEPLVPVPTLELQRYAGRWYEIARLPNSFEDAECLTVTADYTLRADKTVEVVNTCVLADDVDRSVGTARVPDPKAPAKLEVSFFRPFYGDYWVIALDTDYRWALVAEPQGKYLWLLARTPKLESAMEAEVMRRIEAAGYPVSALIRPENERPAPPR